MAHLIGKLCVGVKDTTQAFVPAGISFVGASVVVAVWNATDRFPSGWWLVGFLALVGGVAQLLLGAGRKAIVRTAPSVTPRWWSMRGQALLWNAGTVLVAFGILAPTRMAVATGSVLLVSALGALALELRDARDATSVRARATPWPHGRAPTPAQVQRKVGPPAIADSGGGCRRPTAHASPPSSPAIEARRRRMKLPVSPPTWRRDTPPIAVSACPRWSSSPTADAHPSSPRVSSLRWTMTSGRAERARRVRR